MERSGGGSKKPGGLLAVTNGPQIVIGSSMGGHIALLLFESCCERPGGGARIKALVLIAPAWDMTEELMWKRFPMRLAANQSRRGATISRLA